MPKTRIERMQDYLNESKSLSEKLEKLGTICADDEVLTQDEKNLVTKTIQDIFIPTKEVNGERVFDKEKALENIKEMHRFKADYVAKRGQERVMWLSYFDKKDGPNISENGRNENINRAIEMSNMSGNFLIFNAMTGALPGLFNSTLPPMDGSPENTEEFLKSEVFRDVGSVDFTNEEQEIYYSIGAMEPKKLKKLSPEQKEADTKLFNEYNNYAQTFFANGNNAPWLNEEEIKQFTETKSGKKVTYDKNVIDPIMYEVSTYREENIKADYEKNLSTFMDPDRYNTSRRIAIFKQLSEGKKISEIKVSADDIKAAGVLYDQCQDGQISEEINDFMADAIKYLKVSRVETIEAGDKEKTAEFIKVCEDLSHFHEGFDVDAKDWGRIRSYLVTNEAEFVGISFLPETTNMVKNEYGLSKDEVSLSPADQKTLKQGGFLSNAVDRKSSLAFNAYAYKLLSMPEDQRPRGYDPKLAEGCGKEYKDFMSSYPVFGAGGKPLADKDKLRENVKKQAEFYRQWGEMLAKEPLEDFTNPEKLKDPKVIERALYLNQMAIEFSQNSEDIRQKEETAKLFYESFGGKEYYDRLTDVVSLHQSFGLAVSTYINPEKDISSRAAALSYLERAGEKGGSVEGKTVMDVDPELFSFTNCYDFIPMAMSEFVNLNSTEVTNYVEKGKVVKGVKKNVEEIYDSLKDEKASDLRKSQVKLKKEMSGEKWTLVDEALSTPDNNSLKYDEDPFKKMDIEKYKFSENFVKAIDNLNEEVMMYGKTIDDLRANSPDIRYVGLKNGRFSEKKNVTFDYRNLTDYCNLLVDPAWTMEQKKEFTEDFYRRFHTSKEERHKLLDKIYDKLDNFDIRNYDLSCINGTDKGERGADGLTPSERDMIALHKIVRAEQAFRTTRYGFEDYFENRYNTMEKELEVERRGQNLASVIQPMDSYFAKNNRVFFDLREQMYPDFPHMRYTQSRVALMKNVTDMQSKLISGEIEPEACNSVMKLGYTLPTDKNEKEGAGMEISGQIQSMSKNTSLGDRLKEVYMFDNFGTFYIDGIRASEYLEPLREGYDTLDDTLNKVMQEGKHRFETVTFGISKEGNITPIIQTVEPFDNNFYKEDPGREGRVGKIREDMNRRLGPNKKYYDVLNHNDFGMNKETFEKEQNKFKSNSVPEPAPSFDEEVNRLKGELKAIDTWYHRNSKEFKNVLEALENPSDTKKLIEASEAYINRYVKEDNSFQRRTDLGNARISKIMEIKCLAKDKEFEDKNKVFENISKRKTERQKQGKESSNIDVIVKEDQKEKEKTGEKIKKIGKTEISRNSNEKENKEMGGPS